MTRFFGCLITVCVLTCAVACAQSLKPHQAIATITATATVVGNLDMIVMKDLEFDISTLSPTEIVLNPQTDPRSGEIKIVGNPNGLVRVTNEMESVLQHESGESQLYFTYNLSGSSSDVQSESTLLTQNNEIKLSDRGVYYVWIGGQLSGVEDIIPGNYAMDLTIEVEYIP